MKKILRALSPFHRLADNVVYRLADKIAEQRTDQMLLLGQIAAMALPANIQSIQDAEFRVFSQFGEDGIIQYLIRHIPGIDPTFVEFGVQNYLESNTLFLMMHNGWRGLIMDFGTDHLETAARHGFSWRYGLKTRREFVTPQNINQVFSEEGFAGEIGLLSIDVDSTDWHLWAALTVARPAIVICEYNRNFPHDRPITIPADGFSGREAAHSSRWYFGTSIGALDVLAAEKGYRFVGTERHQRNAFFVRDDLARDLPRELPQASMVDMGAGKALEALRGLPVFNALTKTLETI
jgi:hypothetical protein